MHKSFFSLLLLFFLFVDDASAGLGTTTLGSGLSFGNIRSEGRTIDGLSLHIGTLFRSNLDPPIDEINGLAIALAPASRKMNGLLISPLFAETRDGTTGIAVGLLRTGGRQMEGIFLSGFAIGGKELRGLAVSSVVSFKKSIDGISIGIIGSFAEQARGLVIGGLYAVPTEMRGVSIGGILSGADQKMIGLSIGLVNGADVFYGVQIGAYNVANELHGIQIGIFNFAGNNPTFLRWIPVINAHF
ncbi:MAG: hypothetical protein ABGX83_02685 [Nitrospira sp.]|nr:hypothetical protein [Candidatus Manganitrophaceae bacterium]HIL34872.1 hypothetical protein [Candidatus Manganitrophaceae bacterium]